MQDNIERKPEELAYLAGYIDADGSIALVHVKTPNKYRAVLSVTASRRDILAELQEIVGISGTLWTGKNGKNAKREHSQLLYFDRKAFRVLEMVQPYLRLKGAQAVILIQIGDFRLKHPSGKGFNRNAYYIPRYDEMRALNLGNKSDLIR